MIDSLIGAENLGIAIMQLLQTLIIVLIALTVHEVAHGWAAAKLGDDTAEKFGRLSLNPLRHLDLWGFMSMLLFGFGWAKPVPIRARNFKHPRRDMAISALAGPVANLLLALFSWIILEALVFFVPETLYAAYVGLISSGSDMSFAVNLFSVSVTFLYTFHYLNISLAVFNFLPVPPLDGSRVLYAILPDNLYFGVMKYEHIISMVLMVLLVIGVLDTPLVFLVESVSRGIDFIIPLI